MQKLEAIGIDAVKDGLISDLMELGAIQLEDQNLGVEGLLTEGKVRGKRDGDEELISYLEGEINKTELAIATLDRYSTKKPPLFFTRRSITRRAFKKVLEKKEDILSHREEVLQLNDELYKLRERINKSQTELTSIIPWVKYDLPLEERHTRYATVDLGVVPATVNVDTLCQRVGEKTENFAIKELNRDRELIYLVVFYLNQDEDEVMTALKQSGYLPTQFETWHGMAEDNKDRLSKLIKELEIRIRDVEKKIGTLDVYEDGIKCLYDELIIERDRARAKEQIFATKRTFTIGGWVPEECIESVASTLENYNCIYKIRDPEDEEEVPVLVQNGKYMTPFESVMEMYSLPDYRGFDPTKLYAIFYAMFFGIMLSDAGYGLIITAACAYIIKKYPLEGMMYKMSRMFFWCGISTVFWGAMFGGWFGDIVSVVSREFLGHEVVIKPLWFNPIEDPTRLLIWSLAFGVVHLFVAMGIHAYMLIKRGQFWSAVFDVFSWYFVIVGIVLWLAGGQISTGAINLGKYFTIGGALVLLLTGGREKKGFGKVIGGLGAIYNITGYLSDILSYARLLALGLATGVIASVVNTMGSLGGGTFIGAIILAIVFVIGHLFNLGINALGSFVHASRLQYIEFFGKFYEDGGEEFTPFRKNTKYTKILNDNTEVLKWLQDK